MAPPSRGSAAWYQTQLLDRISEVSSKVDESLRLSRENGEGIRQLRLELGIEGAHGRLPTLEQAIARMDRQQESDHKDLVCRLEALERGEHEEKGRKQLLAVVRSLAGGSAGAAIIGVLAKLMGLIH